jgi:uncharacterized protein (DUF2384 family)
VRGARAHRRGAGREGRQLDPDPFEAAREWLRRPAIASGGAGPLHFAGTEVGAREVEHLIGRIEQGICT